MPPPAQELTADNVGGVPVAEFDAYAARLYQYLQVVEQRLFSEGLHTFGQAPTPAQVPLFLVSGGGGVPWSLARVLRLFPAVLPMTALSRPPPPVDVPRQVASYLNAFFDGRLPAAVVDAIAQSTTPAEALLPTLQVCGPFSVSSLRPQVLCSKTQKCSRRVPAFYLLCSVFQTDTPFLNIIR